MADTLTASTPDQTDAFPRLKRMLDDAIANVRRNRDEQLIDRDYYDGRQLTQEMKNTLAARRQPQIVRNHIKNAVNGVLGVVDSNKVDPRAYPREPSDQDASDVVSDVLRYVADMNHFSSLKTDCLENGLIEGCYALIIECGPDQDPTYTQIRTEEFVYDPRSRYANFKDALYLGVAKWMYSDTVARSYPNANLTSDDMLNVTASGEVSTGLFGGDTMLENRPDYTAIGGWVDKALKQILVVELYYQEGGQWMRAVFCAAGMLDPPAPSAYQDDKGRTRCPIIAQSGYVDRDNSRYGIVRDLRGPQDGINMGSSRILHAANSRQILQTEDAPVVDIDTVRKEAARPDGVIAFGYEPAANSTMVGELTQFVTAMEDEVQRMSPNPAIVGRGTADASGRAVQIRQQAGLVELSRLLGRYNDWEHRVYVGSWNCVRQFWKAAKFVRTLGDEGAFNLVQVNVIEQPGVPQTDPQTGQPVTDPQTGQPVWAQPPVIKNELAKMNVDIVIDTVPDTPNLDQEVWQELTHLVGSNPTYANQLSLTDIIKLSPLAKKRELLQSLEQNQQAAQQAQQAKQQLEQQAAQADVADTQASAAHKGALATQVQVETQTDAMKAHAGIADMGHDQAMDAHDIAIDKASHALEVAKLLQSAHASGPFQTQNAPPA